MDEKKFIDLKKEIEEYKNFAFNKNFFEIALAVIFTTTTQKFTNSISETIIMPFINFLIQETEGDWRKLIFNPTKGLEIEIGKFLASLIEFSITSLVLFVVYRIMVKKNNKETKPL
jgi:large-conductance mechanosensitive channel